MPVHLAIDGYNLLGASPARGGDIEEARDGLIERLRAYKKLRRVKVTVVFDGKGSGRLTRGREMRSGVEVVFSKDGEEADTVLKDLSRAKRGGLTVVTSDRDVAGYATAHGSVVVSSAEFIDLLEMAAYQELKGVDPDEEDYPVRDKKGPSKRPPKQERKKRSRIKKL